MLPSEWNANNSDTEEQTEKQMGQHNPETAKDKPDDVHNGRQASGIGRGIFNFNPKGSEANYRKFETLYTKWNTYNG